MAYKTDDLLKQSLAAIEKHKLFFIEDIVAYLPCSKETFYQHKLHESDALKSALLKVKTEIKVSMRSKWYKSENPTLQMGLMKLIASPDELKQLSMTHVESNNTHEVKEFNLSDLVKFKDDSPKQ
jgi:hypothetical protein